MSNLRRYLLNISNPARIDLTLLYDKRIQKSMRKSIKFCRFLIVKGILIFIFVLSMLDFDNCWLLQSSFELHN